MVNDDSFVGLPSAATRMFDLRPFRWSICGVTPSLEPPHERGYGLEGRSTLPLSSRDGRPSLSSAAGDPSLIPQFGLLAHPGIEFGNHKVAEELSKPGLAETLGLDRGVLEAYDAAWRATAEDKRDGVHPIRLE